MHVERGSFQALLPVGVNFDSLESLQKDSCLVQVEALLLADHSLASFNPPEWIGKLRTKVVLLSASAEDAQPAWQHAFFNGLRNSMGAVIQRLDC